MPPDAEDTIKMLVGIDKTDEVVNAKALQDYLDKKKGKTANSIEMIVADLAFDMSGCQTDNRELRKEMET